MKALQMTLVFVIAFSLGIYVAQHGASSLTSSATTLSDHGQSCKTDLLVVFPFPLSQTQLTTVINTLYRTYPEWSIERDGATTLRVLIDYPTTHPIDEIKLESKAIGEEAAACFTLKLRQDIEALAVATLQKNVSE